MDTATLPTPPADGATPEEISAYQAAMAEVNMRADGQVVDEAVYDDYFGTDQTFKVFLPDGRSYVETKLLAEGERKKYLNATNRDLKINKATQDMSIKMQPGTERAELLRIAIVGWNLRRAGNPVPFSNTARDQFLETANPRTIDLIEKEIRKQNPWLLAEVSIEDIDNEIAALQELRAKKVEEEEGKDGSASR